jgi:uncharacterized protein (TIGR03437 family)
MLLAAFAPLLAVAQSVTLTYTYNGLPLEIFPDSYNAWSYARVYVPRSITIESVTASVQVQYAGVGDLNVFLYSPQGTRSVLLERNCGSLVNIDTTFDDTATSKYADYCPAEAGRGPFRGNEPLANSKGQNAYGYWSLGVENNGSGNMGFLNGFSITIKGTSNGTPQTASKTIVSATTFQSGGVAPGEMISIFGVNLGPSGGVQASGGTLPTTLGGTTVKFGGVAAPLYLVSDRLVVVQAPSWLSSGDTASISLQATAGLSPTISVPVVTARPGVFTYESGSTGQAKAVNQDGTLNGNGTVDGTDKPAPAGSTIAVFATGLGPTDPPVPDGKPAGSNPTSKATLTITATVAGRPATVTYAGAAPGLAGVYQVNVIIPKETTSGAAAIVLTAGGNASQDGATIQIK